MKTSKLILLSLVTAGICQIALAHGWHQQFFKFQPKGHHGATADSIVDSTYHHRGHHHTDSIDYDSIYNDSVLIYHHGHTHFKNDTIPYDSVKHDTTKIDKHNKFGKGNKWAWNFWRYFKQETVDTFYVNNVVYVDSITVQPGTTEVRLPLILDNDKTIRNISFRVSLPDGITLATDTLNKIIVEADTTRLSKSKIYTTVTKNDDVFINISSTRNVIEAGKGAVAYLTFNLADTLTCGDYTIELSGVRLTDKMGRIHRGYTSCSAISIAAPEVKAFDFTDDDSEDAIQKIAATAEKGAYYDLNGRKVQILRSGNVYIHDGKKVIK